MVVQSAFLLLFYLSISNSAEILLECDKDIDCGAGYFCFLSFCERCIPCDVHFHRQPARSSLGEPICARYEDDCGVCLPGYQANDLTDRRRSMECFPLNDDKVSTSPNFSWTGIVWITCVLLLTLTFIACFLRCRRMYPVSSPVSSNDKDEEAEYERRPSAPPAYTAEDPLDVYQVVPLIVHEEADRVVVGSVRTSNHIIIVEDVEHNCRAVPINYDDHFDGCRRQSNHESDTEDERHQLDPLMAVTHEEADTNESTETIPSQWEPTPSMSNTSMNVVLVRSQSEEMIRASSTSQLVRLASDPEILSPRRASVGGESYSYRHVRLSQYRSNSQIIDRPESPESSSEVESKLDGDLIRDSCLTEPCEDGREPDAPESFIMADDDDELSPAIRDTCPYQRVVQNGTTTHFFVAFSSQPPQGGISQDSGFQEQTRRRSRTNEDLLDVTVPAGLGAKRRRRNCSENE